MTTQTPHSRSWKHSSPRPTAPYAVLPDKAPHLHLSRCHQTLAGHLLTTIWQGCWDLVCQHQTGIASCHLSMSALLHIPIWPPLTVETSHKAWRWSPLKFNLHTPCLQTVLLWLQQYDTTNRYRPDNEMQLSGILFRLPSIRQRNKITLDLWLDHIASVTPGWPVYVRRLIAAQCYPWSTGSHTMDDLQKHTTAQNYAHILGYERWADIWQWLTSKRLQSCHLHALRDSLLHDLCEEHVGITKCQLTDVLVWQWHRHQSLCKEFPTWIKLSPTLPAEPLMNWDIPQGPWWQIGADFMDCDSKKVLIVDYFFKYPFFFQMALLLLMLTLAA